MSPLIGGALVGAFGWKSVFLFRVPIVALFVVLAAWTVTPRAGGHGARMVAPTDILRWPVLHAGLLAFLANFAQFAVWLLAPYYLVTERGLSATAGGLLFMLTPIATAVAAPIAGRVTDRWGPRGPMVAGLVTEVVGLLLVGRCGASTPLALVGAALVLVGFGLGMFQVPNLAQIMAAFPARQQGRRAALRFSRAPSASWRASSARPRSSEGARRSSASFPPFASPSTRRPSCAGRPRSSPSCLDAVPVHDPPPLDRSRHLRA